jgi:hypothetical protein
MEPPHRQRRDREKGGNAADSAGLGLPLIASFALRF